MMKCDAVIFDLFGTLIENFTTEGYLEVLSEMARAMAVPEDEFQRAWLATIHERMTGRAGGQRAAIEHVCRAIEFEPEPDRVTDAVEIRLDFTRRTLKPRADAIATLTQLRHAGCKLGLISDCTAEVPELWPATPFAALIDDPVFSCSVGLMKPDPAIYGLACERLSVHPDRCIYVGDGSNRELNGALDAGMYPVLISGPDIDLSGVDRTDARRWDGPTITVLSELLRLPENPLDKPNS